MRSSRSNTQRGGNDTDDADGHLDFFDRSQLAQVKSGKLEKNYEVLEELGSGSFGVVNRGRSKAVDNGLRSAMAVAIKKIPKKKVTDTKKLKAEFNVLRQLDHAHICKVYEFYEDTSNIYLVMDVCTGGTLLETLCKQRTFSEKDAANVMRQILSPLAYLHESNFVFRDLKTENVMFAAPCTEGNIGCVKLIDFGLCCPFDRGAKICKAAGTPYSVAPELVTAPVQYDQKCDAWSSGVVMYILLSGQYPFNGKTKDELLHNIKREPVSFKDKRWKRISREAKKLISELLRKNAESRLEIIEALQSDWLRADIQLPDENLMAQVLESMKQFQSLNMLQKAAITALAWRASDETTKELRQIFESIDRDGNGYVTIDELSKTFKMAGVNVPADFEKMAVQAGTDGNNTIEYTEFLAAAIDKREVLKMDAVAQAFKIFDQDGSGTIKKKELLKILTGRTSNKIREVAGDKAIEALLEQHDTSNDGEIDIEEFMAMLNDAGTSDEGAAAKPPGAPVGSTPAKEGQQQLADDGWFSAILRMSLCTSCTLARDSTSIYQEANKLSQVMGVSERARIASDTSDRKPSARMRANPSAKKAGGGSVRRAPSSDMVTGTESTTSTRTTRKKSKGDAARHKPS